ncbi:MAG: hypothetical protein OER90_17075 [Gemmatimonadota bacterium]|nr:hypothetical protein [Gemmatimonadota bacterium]
MTRARPSRSVGRCADYFQNMPQAPAAFLLSMVIVLLLVVYGPWLTEALPRFLGYQGRAVQRPCR